MRYRRIVAKFGTSLLTAGSARLDLETMARFVSQIARLREQGTDVIAVSSGAVAAGRHRVEHHALRRGAHPSRQAFASVGQMHLMQSWDQLFGWHDIVVAQVLLTRRDLSDRLAYLNARNTLRDLIAVGAVPVVNENDAVALDRVLASRIGENDSLAAYVANLVDADLLAIFTDVDGLYDADPRTHPGAKLIRQVDRVDAAIERLGGGPGTTGSGGMATKLTAARIASQGGCDVVIANGRRPDSLLEVCRTRETGTWFPAAASPLESRKRWILGSITRTGHIVVDVGAVRAVRLHDRSLLPAGVSGVTGQFERGDSVEVRDESGDLIAVGISNYDSGEVGRIRGLRSDRIQATLGYGYGDEIIHRDNLVPL
jgi:glutamate 5-kinase